MLKMKNLIKIPAQLVNILEDSLGEPTVRVRVNEELHVEHASDLEMKKTLTAGVFNH